MSGYCNSAGLGTWLFQIFEFFSLKLKLNEVTTSTRKKVTVWKCVHICSKDEIWNFWLNLASARNFSTIGYFKMKFNEGFFTTVSKDLKWLDIFFTFFLSNSYETIDVSIFPYYHHLVAEKLQIPLAYLRNKFDRNTLLREKPVYTRLKMKHTS